ncbi:alpha-L-arabinofuranosidase C-terminal domain-containing protein [Demequina lignilytica]|uniref:non-reducing end alpha-L-arabinofuranosidase n=1 Tax=Demequina lignilytica TaxID=3051663 RepID=A0AB35MJC6_9MICO|nr:alpha-L-arabinofuranosidase C-terminal domain-containing protein [Demequina sp. SYSU T0a273]MDN4483810.1 alpha-L-arabinofuranosidase C-terminal domain-containing protein [Demequina sp. SYSU T0a273]
MTPARPSIVLTADPARATTSVSPTLIGAFLEDINHAVDGGLNANLVANHSFEGVYLRRGTHTNTVAAITHRKPRTRIDPMRHWDVRGGAIAFPATETDDAREPGLAADRPLVPGSRYARLVSDGMMVLRNAGHGRAAAGIGARRGVVLHLDLLVRRHSFDGPFAARLVDRRGKVLATAELTVTPAPDHPGWERATATLIPYRNSLAALEIGFKGAGTVDVDEVRLIPADHWGAGDPRWSQGVLRRDLVEAIADLKPRFIRFPGGCIVEGLDCANAYDWKRTVGPVERRRPDYNLWGLSTRGGDYSQSFQVGYYEYFLMCEDLGAKPLPVVGVGIACQLRSSETLPIDSDAFRAVTQDVLDLIDWATGDPDTNEWARLRAEAGHPEPFALDMIAIGNENSGPGYLERFRIIREAVRAHRPGIEVVLSAGALAWGTEYEMAWAHARRHPEGTIVDEHFYKSPTWTIDAATRYDDLPRDVRVAVGEYAANLPSGLVPKPVRPLPNSFRSALAEAAFLTGVERNADVVAMTSFAPLLNLVSRGQWEHNLIDFNPFSAMRSANHHVQRMFGATVRERIVPLDAALPEGVLASATAGDDAVVVKLVNTTGRRELVRLRVPGAANGFADVETLSAHDEAQNRLTWDAMRGRRKVTPRVSRREVRDDEMVIRLGGRTLVAVTVPLRTLDEE